MNKFLERYHDQIVGLLEGFDRIVFHGTIRRLHEGFYNNRGDKVARGMQEYLWENGILYKEYRDRLDGISKAIKQHSVAPFRAQKLIVEPLPGSADKEGRAKAIALEQGITQGPVCAFTSMEPAQTFEHRGTHMVVKLKPCPVVYHYRIHPRVGWMYARIQTWFPFEIRIGMNGREWLSRQMDEMGLKFSRQGNCFTWIEDFRRAQELMAEQLKTAWVELFEEMGAELNPLHGEIFRRFPCSYYWTCFESEWATDVVMRDGEFLRSLSGKLMRHGMLNLNSADVMRYLGPRRVNQSGAIRANFSGEIQQDLKRRVEGVRVKFHINANSVKWYDKAYSEQGNVLRVAETTINNVDDLRVYRPKEGGREDDLAWRRMRRGIADLHRRAEVSGDANQRLMDALAAVDDSRTVEELTGRMQKPVLWNGRRVRALRPWGEDRRLLEAVNRGEFVMNGLRNRDLQALLYDKPAETAAEKRRRSAAVSRKLRMLRAHGVLRKVSRTHRYQVTVEGRVAMTAVLTTAATSLAQLSALKAA